MHKALHPREDIYRLHLSRKAGGRGLAIIEDCVDASIQWLEDYIEKHEQGLITTIKNNTDNRGPTELQLEKNGKKNNSTGALND